MTFQHQFLEFKELKTQTLNGKRHYSVDGQLYPSVTTVLSGESKPALEAWVKRVGFEKSEQIKTAAAFRGTGLHEMLEKYVLNEPVDYKKSMPSHVELFNQIKPVLDKRIGKIYAIEAPLYSKALGVAGRVDFIADFDGVPAIVDFKSSTRRKKQEYMTGYYMQTALYSFMMYEMHKMYIPNSVIIVASPETPHGAEVFKQKTSLWLPKAVDLVNDFYVKTAQSSEK